MKSSQTDIKTFNSRQETVFLEGNIWRKGVQEALEKHLQSVPFLGAASLNTFETHGHATLWPLSHKTWSKAVQSHTTLCYNVLHELHYIKQADDKETEDQDKWK